MHEPDDFGRSPAQTLATIGHHTPTREFQPFWNTWHERVFQDAPALSLHSHDDPTTPDPLGAPGITHTLQSLGDITIGTRLIVPPDGDIKGAVISIHGYDVPPGEPLDDKGPWTDKPVAALKVRLRGYPGSSRETGDLTAHPSGYITHGLDGEPQSWVIVNAVADVVNAYRALRAHLGPDVPISLHGHSLGAAISVLACSLLLRVDPPFRMVLGLPTLGHMRWRLANALAHTDSSAEHTPADPMTGTGTGMQLARFIRDHRGIEDTILHALDLCDTVVHAHRVECPTICKLAKRDDVVPAPAAAAVFNALGAAPGWKWRFLVDYGHFDGGIADLRRHAMFERLSGEFLCPTVYPGALMQFWEPVLSAGQKPPETAR